MFKNYLKSAWRFLWQNKVFTLINALGLSVALAASFIILLYVINEWSYDHCHKNRKRVYRVLTQSSDLSLTQTGTPYFLSSAIKEEFPQVEKAVTARTLTGFKLKVGEEMIPLPYVVGTTSEVFDIFTIPLLTGKPGEHLLADENSLVLCRELAEKFFPGKDLVGKEVTALVNNKEHTFTVTGVFEDIPVNSTFRAKCIVNGKWTIDPLNKAFKIDNIEKSWSHNLWLTWIMISPGNVAKDIEDQTRKLESKYMGEKPFYRYQYQNLSDVYLKSANIANSFIAGNLKNVRLFSAIAFLIILVAAGNYIILSTAVSTRRAKEIGIRKTNGALGGDLRIQMLGESVLMALLVLPIALVLTWFSLPYAGMLFQTKLILIESNLFLYALIFVTLTILIGIISGLYASTWLSRLKVVDILKNSTPIGSRKAIFRSSLIVLQLVIFCGFVASTLIVRSQYLYALKKNPGYYTTDVLMIEMGQDIGGYRAFLQAIKSNPNVISAAGTMQSLPMMGTMTSLISHYTEKEKRVKVEGLAVDSHFLETMGVSFVRGRDFSAEFGTDLKEAVIFNETAMKLLGIPDSADIKFGSRNVIGVVKDFNLHSIRTDIPPLMITMTDRYINQLAVRYKPGTRAALIPSLEAEWKKVAGDRKFEFDTIENVNLELYKSEKNLSLIITLSACFTLFIAALGLLGITLFTARTRTKEIGIRKAFGSPEKSIVLSFLKKNFFLVIIATLLSVPITIYIMDGWLSTFSYHIMISWWVFAVSFVLAMLLVLLTVLFHAIKASRTNPVDSLRYE